MRPFTGRFPESTTVPLKGGPVVRWGVMAPGGIAGAFVAALKTSTDQRVTAVASRARDRAETFARQHGIDRAFGSYEELAASDDVDIVYIASPHSGHLEQALMSIAGGKHVLVEKPIALNADEARQIADAARSAGLFAMEALWTRFQPKSTVIRQLLDDGALGDIRLVTADFGFRMQPGSGSGRMFDPALGGGALLDLGVYPLWFSHFALGSPEAVHASGGFTSTGVDEQAAITLDHAAGAQSLVACSMAANLRGDAVITGTEARIEVAPLFLGPGGFSVVTADARYDWVDPTHYGVMSDGLAWEAVAVAQHVADGRTEAPEHPLDTTISVLETIDAARACLGPARL